jgi:quercetin dioxygenase-like cupin family protein
MKSMVYSSMRLLALSASFGLFISAVATAAEKDAVGVEAKPLLKTTKTVTDGPLMYPATGTPEISSVIITVQPGGQSNLHKHPVVTVVHVLEGEADLHVGEKVFHYKAGDAWVEPIDELNQVFNVGTVPLKNLVVFVGSEGNPNSIAAE